MIIFTHSQIWKFTLTGFAMTVCPPVLPDELKYLFHKILFLKGFQNFSQFPVFS